MLALFLLSGIAVSCSDSAGDKVSETTPQSAAVADVTSAEEEETGNVSVKDNLPEDLDLGGMTVQIYSFSFETYDIIGKGEETGDVVLDAVYRRTKSVAERLNADIKWSDSPQEKWTDFSSELNTVIMAGDDVWQIVFAAGNATIQSNRGALFTDLKDSEYLDYSQPWWWEEAMAEVSLDGKERKYLVGDIALSNYLKAGCYYFNKNIYADLYGDPNDLYETVIGGDWTVDRLIELSSGAYQDLNGDSAVNDGDLYGLKLGNAEYLKHSEYGFDVRHYYRDENGYPVLDYDIDRGQKATDKLYQLLFDTMGNVYQTDYVPNSDFAQRHTFFHASQLMAAFSDELRKMEDDYGIIPYPKLDEDQTEYHNLLHNSSSFVTIPITCKNVPEVCAVIEAMCSESFRSVVEPFYETAMKTKYSRDSDSGKCIDIIHDVTKKNLAYEYNGQFGAGNLIADLLSNKKTNFSSTCEKQVSAANKKIAKAIAKLEAEQG